jgi:hypothetical protein
MEKLQGVMAESAAQIWVVPTMCGEFFHHFSITIFLSTNTKILLKNRQKKDLFFCCYALCFGIFGSFIKCYGSERKYNGK